ncbi:hypothetical protein G3T16_09875 [Kineobactrum salinum]|uniref:Thioredoxin domain-containing protein n=2 Tax=Kineobactrum salinum TaxID=2708301 RepID=A0A6C0U8B1_9GAMM|nr:hypothetical protein G3T16_09875 [Kineobactrum salinum]
MVLLLIAGIPVTVILAATWLWWFVVRGDLDLVGMLGTANRGELIQPPRALAQVEFTAARGAVPPWADRDHQWSLLVANSGPDCGPQCEHNLYLTRQIHMAMGKEVPRIRRLYVADRSPMETALAVAELSDQRPLPVDFPALLATEHRGLSPLQIEAAAFQDLFPEQLAAADTWYLVDPAGWLMMAYDGDDSYKDVISDLKFLLKNSGDQ